MLGFWSKRESGSFIILVIISWLQRIMDGTKVNLNTCLNNDYELSIVYVYPPTCTFHNKQPTILNCLFLINHMKLADAVRSLFYLYIFIEWTKLYSLSILMLGDAILQLQWYVILVALRVGLTCAVWWSSMSQTLIKMIAWRGLQLYTLWITCRSCELDGNNHYQPAFCRCAFQLCHEYRSL